LEVTDLPNTEAQAKAELWKAMGCPRWDLLPVEPIKPAPPYYGYLIYTALIAGVVGCGVMLLR
jgi:hypothetical protein